MADRMKRELNININTNVDTQPIKAAEQELNGFFEKYENRSLELGIDKRSLKIDTKDFYKAIAAAQQLESSIDGVRRSAPAMIKALNTDIEFAENVKGELQEAMAVFNDGSIARGFNEIIDKLSDGLSMVAVDLGGRVDYIKKQITGMLSQIREAGSVSLGNEIEFGSLNQKEINQRIQLIGKLIDAQKELQSFSPTQLDEYDFESGYDTKGLERLGRNLERASAKMEEYNLRTTEQLRRREELIDRIYRIDYSSYDHQEAKSKIGDGYEYEYEANIASLREYIEQRQDLLRELRSSEDELFSSEGISEYVMQLNEQIQQYEKYIKELQDLKNLGGDTPIGDPSEIVNALKEIKEVIKEIKDAFEPLTTALNTEGTAFSNMAKEGAASLDTLLDKLKELGSLMNNLNQKDFNVTNLITQKGNVSESVLALREQAKNLLNVVNVLVEAQNEIYKTNNGLYQGAMRQSQGVMGAHLWELQNFDSADIYKKITKSGSEAKLMEHIATLEYYRDVVLTIVKEINKYAPNTIDTSVLEQVQQQKKLSVSGETSGSDLKDKKDSAGGIESLLEEIKSSREQIESELKEIRTLIEATFDLSTIDMKRDAFTAILDSVYQQFVELQVKIKALDFSIDVPDNISFTNTNKSVAQSGDNTEGSIVAAANAIDKEGQAAEEAAISKIKFADANKEVALSSDATAQATKYAADSIKEEGQAAEEAAAKSKKALKGLKITQEEIIEQYHDAGKRGQVRNNLADMFNKSLENAGIDASKIIASYGEKSYKDDDGDTRYFDYIKLVANGTNEIGKAVIVTREYNIATGELLKTVTQFSEAKDTFDLSTVKNTASSQFAELEKRMGSFKIDISDVKNALNNITDEASFKVFQNELDAANQKLKEIKASLKSSRSLDPIVNAESMMSNLETTVATYRENIKKFTDVEGFDKLDSSLTTITSKLEEFKVAQSAGDGEKMASIVAEINKEITSYNANLKLVTARYQENTRASNEYAKAEKQRIAEENAAWDEYRAEQKAAAQKERDIALAYEAKAAKEAAESEKELAQARKEANSFYEQEEKRIAAEEDAAWKEYKKEKEAAAQKEREINLAYEAKAAKEAADAEKELAQARKEADAFYKEEEQQIKNDNNEKQKELNALYIQRKAIISELLDYTKKLNQATDEASKKAAQQAIDSAASRLGDKNTEIWQYGDLVDVLKLNQQDESLTEGLRRFNWDSYIKNAGKSSKLNLGVEQQLSLLTKQQALWEKNGQLTDKLRQKINSMFDALSQVTNASELSTWKKQWSIVKNEVTETKYQIEAAEKAQKEASNAINAERKASAEYWNSAFKESIENLGPKKNPELEQLNAYYKEQEKLNKQNQNYGKTRYNQEIRNYEKLMASVRAIDNESGLSDGFQKKVTEYKDLYEELGRLRKQFEDDPNAANDSALTNKFQDTALQAEKARKEIHGVIKETDRLDALTADGGFEIKLFDQSKFDNAKDAMRAYANEVSNGTFEEKGFNDAGTEMYGTLINSEGAIEKVTIALKEASGEIVAFKTGTEGVTSVWKTASKSVVGGVAKFGAMYLSFHDIIRYLRQGVESVREIDLAMTELRKVTDETEATYAKFLNTASKTAGSIGSTVKDFTTVTSDFARLGYSINEASELAKTALIYENVGDGFSSVDEASASIISTMKAFGIEAENTMQIVDKFNAVGNNFAIDSKGIGDALQRSASALVEGGNSIDEAIGIVTAANSVIQNPEQVGTALKTLSLRLRSTKVELEEMGEDAEGAATSTAKLRAQLLGLTGGKVDIMLDENTFKNTTQILREMAAVWYEMDDISRAGALELMGGKRQANILSSLITNFETVEQVIETSANSAGSALAENEKYLDSIQGKIDQFNNAFQTFWNNLLNSEMIKGVTDFGTAILTFLNKLGPQLTSLIAIISGISAATLFKGINTWLKDATGDVTLVNALAKSFGNLKSGIVSVGKALASLATSHPILLAITAVLATITAVTIGVAKAEKEAAEAANKHAQEVEDANAALANYKQKAASLRKELDSGNLSEQEAYDVRKQLMGIQDELISRYGKEANGINLVTGAIEDQISAINDLAVANAQAWLNENSKKTGFLGLGDSPIEAAKDYMTSEVNVLVAHAGKEGFKQSFKNAYGDDWKKYYDEALSEFENFIINDLGGASGMENFSFFGFTREQVIENADQITTWLRDYQKNSANKVDFSDFISLINNEIDEQVNTDEYNTHKQNFDAYLENTALATYTKEYGSILNAQKELEDAMSSGDNTLVLQAKEKLDAAINAAKDAAGEDVWLVNWFDGLDDQYNAAVNKINFKKAWDDNADNISSSIKEAITAASEKSGYKLTDEELINMTGFVNKDFDWSAYTPNTSDSDIWGEGAESFSEEQKNAYELMASAASKYGLQVNDVIAALVELGYVQGSVFQGAEDNVEAKAKSFSLLTESINKYNEVQAISAEIVADGTEISEEYFNALKEFIEDETALAECIDTTNGYVVTNADELGRLIKQTKKSNAEQVKLSKAQARLKYYDLYKQMRKLTKEQKQLTGAALDEVNALYKQMSAVEKTIAKYSMLEAKLLGTTNAFDKLADAQAADEEMDYGSKAEELVNVLANAFNTAELGTEAAQVAIAGLIPDEVIDKTKTLDEQMQQIYDYFSDGPLTKLFTIKFDDDGEIESVEMTKKNIEGYVNDLLKTNIDVDGDGVMDGTIFQGTWDEFTLNPAIQSLEDFRKATGLTEEVIFAFLTSLEKYDIGWLGDDFSTLLDQLMDDDLDYKLYDRMQKIADLEMKIANGNALTEGEQKQYGTLVGEMESLEEEAVVAVTEYSELSNQLEQVQQKMVDLNKELSETENETEKLKITQELDKAGKEASDLLQQIKDIGGSPSEFILQVSADEAQEQIDEFKENLTKLVNSGDKNAISVKAVIDEVDEKGLEELGLTKNADGTWSGLANWTAYSNLDPASKQEVLDYLNLINSKHTIDALMGEGIVTVEEHLESIVEILEKTYTLLVEANVDDSEVVTFREWLKHPWQKTIDFVANWFDGDDGASDVNGTAHASGTAHARGSWGAPKTETALTGELGRELIVRGNRWFTVGDNGAEFTDIKKGDIIFNHKQTEDLLSNGYVTGRGKAYASGTAYALAKDSGAVGSKYNRYTYNSKEEVEKARAEARQAKWEKERAEAAAAKEREQNRELKRQTSYSAASSINTFDDLWKKVSQTYGNKGSSDSGDSAKDNAEDVIDFIEIKLEEIEAIISKTTAEIENLVDDASQATKKSALYNELVAREYEKKDVYDKAEKKYNSKADEIYKKIDPKYQDMAKFGDIAIEDFVGEDETEQAELIQEYREWANKADEMAVNELEAVARIEELRLEQFQDHADDYDNRISLIESESDLINSQMELQEAQGERLSPKYYQELIKNTNKTIGELTNKREQMQADLKAAVEAGDVQKGSNVWYQMINDISAVDAEITQCQIDIEEFNNSINDLKWEALDKLISRFDSLDSELSHLYDRFTDVEDVVDDNGDWTDKSIAAMGVLAQQMEIAQAKTEQYDNAIIQLKKDYKNGLYSTDEYNEKLAELTENQWESIEAYEDAKDKIVDLNKARIEAIKEGMQEEIDAYKELIDLKKEALDAEKDLHDFEKSVAEKQKSISDIRRKLAALEGDTSASAAAKRKQLEAELLEAEADLEETYYDRSIQNQKDALDQEYESFEENKNAEMETLDEYLTNEEQVISDSMNTVKSNANVVLSEIQAVSQQYGISISSELTAPWTAGSNAVSAFAGEFATSASATMNQLDLIIAKERALERQALATAQAMLAMRAASGEKITNVTVPTITVQESTKTTETTKGSGSNGKSSNQTTHEVKKGETLSSIAKKYLGSTSKWREIYNANKDIIKDPNKIYVGQKLKIPKYATGTLGTKNDQFAWIDEVGEELVLHADSSGKLAYLTKGSSVIPSDLTEKLLDLAVDPTQTLENSRPIISAPHITNNEFNIDMSIAEVVHIDTVTNDTIPDLTKAVEKQMDKYMKQLNGQIRKYAR